MTIFMLKNFGKEDFAEKVEVTGPGGSPLSLELLLGKLNQPNVIDALPVETSSPELLPSVSARDVGDES